jgi:hypothetical protein
MHRHWRDSLGRRPGRRRRSRTRADVDRVRDHLATALRVPPKPRLSELKPSMSAPSTESAHPRRTRYTRPKDVVVGCVHHPPPQAGRCLAVINQHAHAPHARARAHSVHRALLRHARSAWRTTRARTRAEWEGARRWCARKARATRKAEPRWERRHADVGVLRTAGSLAARFVRGRRWSVASGSLFRCT